MVKAGILGATGYTGIELLRILQNHPEVEVEFAATASYASQPIADIYPHFHNIIDLRGVQADPTLFDTVDVVFSALPHGMAMQVVPDVLQAGKKLIDLSADFRLQDVADFQNWYQHPAPKPEFLSQAIYGLPEINRTKISAAKLLANPGCYPTSCALAVLPALKENIVQADNIIFDSKSGVSGAGRSLSLGSHFSEITENFKAYNIAGAHRHTPEIEQTLSSITGKKLPVQFTPHLVPMVRGILTTAYLSLKQTIAAEKIWQVYQNTYAKEPFVRVRPLGDLPQTKQVMGSNYCDIGLQIDPRTNRLIVVSVIDNLIKGASGQAVQNMNLMFGLPETMGLKNLIPIYP